MASENALGRAYARKVLALASRCIEVEASGTQSVRMDRWAELHDAVHALVAERNAYRKSLEQAVAWARAKCERIGVAEEAWLEDARKLLRS